MKTKKNNSSTIDDLRENFESSLLAQKYQLNFKEYALIYRVMEGVKVSQIFETLFLSHATVSRIKYSVAKKLGASSFEQALILAGKLELI